MIKERPVHDPLCSQSRGSQDIGLVVTIVLFMARTIQLNFSTFHPRDQPCSRKLMSSKEWPAMWQALAPCQMDKLLLNSTTLSRPDSMVKFQAATRPLSYIMPQLPPQILGLDQVRLQYFRFVNAPSYRSTVPCVPL